MDDRQEKENQETLRRRQAAVRRAQLKKQKDRQMWLRAHVKMLITGLGCLFVFLVIVLLVKTLRKNAVTDEPDAQAQSDGTWESEAPDSELTVFDGGEVSGRMAADVARTESEVGRDSENAAEGNGAGDKADANEPDSAAGADTAPDSPDADESGESGTSQADSDSEESSEDDVAAAMTTSGMIRAGSLKFISGYEARSTVATIQVPEDEEMQSTYAILIDESTGTIIAQKNPKTVISPASMTKILTVLVAAEQLDLDKQLDDKVTITIQMTDYAYRNDLSVVGFEVDEQVTVRDLFFGTILPSGADAAIALATYTAGSEEKFVGLMNDKLKELGLSNTAHFTNCVGLYDENHHCTVYDMAMILKAAAENEFCREVLSAHTYNTSQTTQHPDGLLISNWFLRRIEDKDTGGEVLCAKTGFVNESGSCAASCEISKSGIPYICVTADAHSSWRCIYDHVTMYSRYAK